MTKHKFNNFRDALEFLETERKAGRQGIYFPRGGDNPRKWTTQPAEHIVIILEVEK